MTGSSLAHLTRRSLALLAIEFTFFQFIDPSKGVEEALQKIIQ